MSTSIATGEHTHRHTHVSMADMQLQEAKKKVDAATQVKIALGVAFGFAMQNSCTTILWPAVQRAAHALNATNEN